MVTVVAEAAKALVAAVAMAAEVMAVLQTEMRSNKRLAMRGRRWAPSLVVSRASWLLAQHSSCCAAVPVPARLGHLASFPSRVMVPPRRRQSLLPRSRQRSA